MSEGVIKLPLAESRERLHGPKCSLFAGMIATPLEVEATMILAARMTPSTLTSGFLWPAAILRRDVVAQT
jgi:hypothetical protein